MFSILGKTLIFLSLLLLAACQQSAVSSQLLAVSTPTMLPSRTPLPTSLLQATASVQPSIINSQPSAVSVQPTAPSHTPLPTFPSQTAALIEPALQETSPSPTQTPKTTPQSPITTLLFTGVIVPARCVQAALDEIGDPNYPYTEVRETISDADLAVGTFNATMSDFPPHTGCVRTYVLVGASENADALAQAGFDLMGVATNHIKDCGIATCGDRAFFDTLENLRRVGLPFFGAGNDQAEALQPVVVEINGVRFGFVSAGDSKQGEWTFAGPDSPGIARLDSENIKAAIDAARKAADVVIFMPHWGPEDMAVPNWIQRNQAQEIVALGADLVVGNHTHVVQAIQEIDGIPVFYGLGNFVFDQGLRDHRQGVILLVKFQGAKYIGYELIPTHVDPDGRVNIAAPDEAEEILRRVEEASQAIR